MRWEDRRRSNNVEDRRGRGGLQRRIPRGGRVRVPRGGSPGGVRRAGGSSLILFGIVAILLWIFVGINPVQLIEIVVNQGGETVVSEPQTQRTPEQQVAEERRAQFLTVVLAETEDTWQDIFERSGLRYDAPLLVLYSGFAQSACGFSSAAVGPFYCPNDRKVYIDLSFFDQLAQRFQAPGDFAQAYVLAHEVGHHVQNLTGALGEFHRTRGRMGPREANLASIRIELQADCYAGIWAHAVERIGILEDGDIEEALGAASAVGDDMIQRREQGYVVPESFNHGTARQRTGWFRRGYESGDPAECDTRRV